MIAATMPTLQQWRAGTLSDAALWHKCFFDPPETFDSTTPSGGSSATCKTRRMRCVSLIEEQRFRFHLTFETDQSTYAILEHVTEWGPCVIFVNIQERVSGTLYTAKT